MVDILARMRQLIGTTAAWTADNQVLADGEIGVERAAAGPQIRIGDGVTPFLSLPVFSGVAVGQARGLVDEQIAAAGSPTELRVAVPAGARSIELEWEIATPVGTDQVLTLQLLQGSTIVAAAAYSEQSAYGSPSSATAGANYVTGQAYWTIGGGVNFNGSVHGQLADGARSDNVQLRATYAAFGFSPAREIVASELDYYFGTANQRQTITGFRVGCGGGITAGSVVRAFAMI